MLDDVGGYTFVGEGYVAAAYENWLRAGCSTKRWPGSRRLGYISHNREDESKEPSLGSGSNNSSDARAEALLLVSKLNDAKLDSEELRLPVVQKAITLKAVTETILQLDKLVESLESENNILLQINDEALWLSRSTMIHPIREKMTLTNRVPKEFIGIVIPEQDAIHRLCSRVVSELRRHEGGNE